jgi:hypothetical protein
MFGTDSLPADNGDGREGIFEHVGFKKWCRLVRRKNLFSVSGLEDQASG